MKKFSFEAFVRKQHSKLALVGAIRSVKLHPLVGKKIKITIEAIE